MCIFMCMCEGLELLWLVVLWWDELFLPVWSVKNTNMSILAYRNPKNNSRKKNRRYKEVLISNSWWKINRSAREMGSAHLKAGRWPRHGVGLTGRRWQQKWQQGGGWSIFEICERAPWNACLWVWKFGANRWPGRRHSMWEKFSRAQGRFVCREDRIIGYCHCYCSLNSLTPGRSRRTFRNRCTKVLLPQRSFRTLEVKGLAFKVWLGIDLRTPAGFISSHLRSIATFFFSFSSPSNTESGNPSRSAAGPLTFQLLNSSTTNRGDNQSMLIKLGKLLKRRRDMWSKRTIAMFPWPLELSET